MNTSLANLLKINSLTRTANGYNVVFPVTQRYHTIYIGLTAADSSDDTPTPLLSAENVEDFISMLSLKVDGKEQRGMTGKELCDLNERVGMPRYEIGGEYVAIHLAEPWMRTMIGEDVKAWGMKGVNNFTLDIDLAGTYQDENLDIYVLSDVEQVELGLIRKIRRSSVTFTSDGQKKSITDFLKNDPYAAIHFYGDNTEAQVIVDRVTKFDCPRGVAMAAYGKHGMQHIDGGFTISFDHRRRGGEALALKRYNDAGLLEWQAAEFTVELTCVSSGIQNILTETFGLKD